MMEIFINECSFHEQFFARSDTVVAFRKFLTLLNLFNEHKAAYILYHPENLFYVYRIIEDELLIASLNNLPDRSLARAIKGMLFNKLNARGWQSSRVHASDDLFVCMEEVVTDTSMAELAERKLQKNDLIGLLLNFPSSKFTDLRTVEIFKNESAKSTLDCLDDHNALTAWLNEQLQSDRFDYDVASAVPPTDLQTVLRDSDRFSRTTQYYDGRRIYKEITEGYYWYVDNLHNGEKAHLEVFNNAGKHLGEAQLDGTLDVSKAKISRRLAL